MSRVVSLLRGGPWPALAGLVLAAGLGLGAAPILDDYRADVTGTLLIDATLAVAWNMLAGFGGQISLGLGAFVGTGAYATGLFMIHTGSGAVPAMLVGAASAGALAAILAPALLPMQGSYFAVGTLAAALALQAWLHTWRLAGGSNGLDLPMDKVPETAGIYRMAVLVAAFALAAALLVRRSRFGLRLMAVRDNAAAAAGLGVSVWRHRFGVLVLSSTLTGLAGSLAALQQMSFEPVGMLGIGWTLNALLMTVVGGIGTLLGPVLGVVVVYLLTRQLQEYPEVGLIIEGVVLLVMVRFAPRGLWPLLTRGLRGLAGRLPGRPPGAGARLVPRRGGPTGSGARATVAIATSSRVDARVGGQGGATALHRGVVCSAEPAAEDDGGRARWGSGAA
jgi:branched-chain amino acid transport system permease protein